MKSSADSRLASCGVLAAFLSLAERSEALRLSLPDGLLPWYYSDPQDWKTLGSECCCVLWLFASSGPVMQWLIGWLCGTDASKIKSLHNIWLCIKAFRPAQCNLRYWTMSCALCSNREQNRNKIDL